MEHQAPNPQAMPPLVDFLLTRRLPCAAVMTAMLMAMWLPLALPPSNPAVVLLMMMVGMLLHLMTPALVAVVTFGGGLGFALQVSAISAAAVTLLSGFSLTAGAVTLLIYGLLPAISAVAIMQPDGIRRSAQYVATGAALAIAIGLLLGSAVQDMGLREWVTALLAPLFADLPQTMNAEQMQAMQMFKESMVSIMPALLVLTLWMAWWGNMGTARHWAQKYGFYRGNEASMLTLGFGKPVAYLFTVLLLLVVIATGDLLYLVGNAAIVTGGLLAAQGVAVAHSWLKAKGLTFSIGLMYLMLLIWSAMIVPFVIVGLMDIWFDYRRKIPAAGG